MSKPKSNKNRRQDTSAFLRSLNVERDWSNGQLLRRYVLTANALRAVRRITGVLQERHGGAWTVTGPFGTGKSAFLLFLSHLLAPSGHRPASQAVALLKSAAPSLAEKAFPSKNSRYGLIPIRVSGTAEPLPLALLRGLEESLKSTHLDLPAAYRTPVRRLVSRSKSGRTPTNGDVIAAMEQVVSDTTTKVRGCRGFVLLLDELGKLLEYAAANPGKSDVFALQRLAELAARSEGRLSIIAALHQDFRVYANNLPPSDRAEWEKIRGRFEDVAFEEPPSQLLRFLSLAWGQLRELEELRPTQRDETVVRALAAKLWECGLAPPGLGIDDGLDLLEACTPIHPLAAVLVGPLFRRVGQNERSAFTFLTSDGPHSLREFIRLNPNGGALFDCVCLYEYLASSLGNALLNTADARRWAEAFEAESRHPELDTSAVTILRATALLSIASRWLNVRAGPEALRYALSPRLEPRQVDAALGDLTSASIVVHRRYNNSYALWEGSDVDVEARIAEGRERVLNRGSIPALLRRHYRVRPILARRHSFETGTLRFYSVEFMTTSELVQRNWPFEDSTDGRLIVVLPRNHLERAAAVDATKGLGQCCLARIIDPSSWFSDFALELGAIGWARRNTPELSHDSVARRELQGRWLSVERALDGLVSEVLHGGARVQGPWFYLGEECAVADDRALNNTLSCICDAIYPEAPKLHNEIINRRELSSAAAAARRNLIERMISVPHEPELGIEGNPPERSIYRSLLSQEGGLGLHRCVGGRWAFRRPPRSSSGRPLFLAMETFFRSAAKDRKDVDELFDLMREPPFGLRDGPIPILVCAGLLISDSELALYEDGAFCPRLSVAAFERLVKSPERFSIRRWKLSGVRSQLFVELERLVLGRQSATRPVDQRLLRVARPLMRFFASLPAYTMHTADLAPRTQSVRDAFTEATEPDVLFFETLPTICGLAAFEHNSSRRDRSHDIAAYVDEIRAAVEELRGAFPRLLDSVQRSLAEGFNVSAAGVRELRSAVQAEVSEVAEFAIERDLRLLISRLLATDGSEDAWIDGVASFLAERPIAKWRDEDRARFNVRLRQFVRRIQLLRATVSDRPPHVAGDGTESVRVSLTGTAFGQVDHAVHLGRMAQKRVRKIEARLEETLKDEGDSVAVLGALCRLLRRRLTEDDPGGSGDAGGRG